MTNVRFPKASLAALLAAAVLTAGCAGEYGTKETVGTLAGAALGGWAGSAISNRGAGGAVAIAAGTVIGGVLGNQIGRGLDKADRLEANRTQYRTLEYGRSGERGTWYNPDSGNSGTIAARPAYQNNNGQYCREFTQSITVGGRSEQAYGTACRQADGAWKVVS